MLLELGSDLNFCHHFRLRNGRYGRHCFDFSSDSGQCEGIVRQLFQLGHRGANLLAHKVRQIEAYLFDGFGYRLALGSRVMRCQCWSCFRYSFMNRCGRGDHLVGERALPFLRKIDFGRCLWRKMALGGCFRGRVMHYELGTRYSGSVRNLDRSSARPGCCRTSFGGSGRILSGVRRTSTLLVLPRQFSVADSLVRITCLRVHRFQVPAAYCGFRETLGPSMQCSKTLIQTHITRCLRKCGHQRHQSFGRHVIGNEQIGIGQSGTDGNRNFIWILLLDDGSRGLELVYHHRALFGGDQPLAAASPHHGHDLLVIPHVQQILRLHSGQGLVQVTRPG